MSYKKKEIPEHHTEIFKIIKKSVKNARKNSNKSKKVLHLKQCKKRIK